jgi:hypothetical protein
MIQKGWLIIDLVDKYINELKDKKNEKVLQKRIV